MPAHLTIVPDTPQGLYLAIDLGSTRWHLAMASRTSTKIRRRWMPARDLLTLWAEVVRARQEFDLPEDCSVFVCHEAGRDGFWVHRWLEEQGFNSLVVDPGSVEISGRKRRAKTDRLDSELLLRSLLRWHAGDRQTFRPVHVPSREAENARQANRRRSARIKDRTRHRNRIASLLATRGIKSDSRLLRTLEARLDKLVGADGRLLPAEVKDTLRSELELLRLCEKQIRDIDRQMHEAVAKQETEAAQQVAQLVALYGVGVKSAWVLVHELFGWRKFTGRKKLAAAAGLVPVPHHSDTMRRDQGISKAGNSRIRQIMNQLAWLWLRYQPESDLTRWYYERWGNGSGRQRRIGIVALSRKLLIALWRFLERGLVPTGAVTSA